MPLPSSRRSPPGFTVLELLVAAAISAMVLLALASSLQLFGDNLESVRVDADTGPEQAVALMTDMARYGWSVEQPDDDQLDVVDALGARTTFALDNGLLRITRPSGAHGTLLAGVSDFSIHAEPMRRLREDAPLFENRAWWEKTGPSLDELTVESALPVALGFTMDSAVPDDFDTVADVDEHALSAYLSTLVLAIAYLPAIPPDPNEPIVGDDGNPNNGNGNKVDICHSPPGTPDAAHTLSVSVNAVDAHLAHGDTLGACEVPPPPDPEALLVFELYEARAPDDARPVGPMLASTSVSSYALPSGSALWVQTEPGPHGDEHPHNMDECSNSTSNGKVMICHVPPGNPSNAHSITISPNAVPAHLAHGDYYGCCGQHETPEDIYTLVINAPTAETALDLSPLGAEVLPGRAYTLVMSLQGPGSVHLGAFDGGTLVNSGVAQSADAGGNLVPADLQVPFRLEGAQQITQTAEHAPISQLSLTLEMDDGKTVSGSASVLGQVGVPAEWLGTVPGQLLELSP